MICATSLAAPLQAVKVVHRMCGLLSVYCVAPIFGVDFEQESAPPPLEELTVDVRFGVPLCLHLGCMRRVPGDPAFASA